jgi:hypothetical protein
LEEEDESSSGLDLEEEDESGSDFGLAERWDRPNYMEAWIAEQPMLSEQMEAAEKRYWKERAESEARLLQELDRVCALSSPRVAFERRLDYTAGIRVWNIACGTISGEPCWLDDDKDGPYDYRVSSDIQFKFCEDGTRKFLAQDHGNDVEIRCVDPGYDDYNLIFRLDPGYKEEDADDGNKEKGGDST